jgi:hypothetical protein
VPRTAARSCRKLDCHATEAFVAPPVQRTCQTDKCGRIDELYRAKIESNDAGGRRHQSDDRAGARGGGLGEEPRDVDGGAGTVRLERNLKELHADVP